SNSPISPNISPLAMMARRSVSPPRDSTASAEPEPIKKSESLTSPSRRMTSPELYVRSVEASSARSRRTSSSANLDRMGCCRMNPAQSNCFIQLPRGGRPHKTATLEGTTYEHHEHSRY